MKTSADFDLVVYGASGFTGRLVAEHLARRYGPGSGLSWAMAGRSGDKLAAVRDEIGAPPDTPLIVAGADDPVALDALAARTRAVITTVGPFQLYGSTLVAACAAGGTDYLDLSGETAWMRAMIDAHEAQARASGARILFSCGFDSIPFELGVLYLQSAARARFGRVLPRVKGRVRVMRGGFSGGTAASGRATAAAARDPGVLSLLRDPFCLTPGFTGPAQPSGMAPAYDPDLEAWTAPFVMAPINTRNVHRSNALQGHAYGTDFVYDEMLVTGPGDTGEAAARAIAARPGLIGGEDDLEPGQGPSREEREAGGYDILFIGHDSEGPRLHAVVTGDRDPGYGSTSKIIVESAICLLEAADVPGGLWTPGAALGLGLVSRLSERAGLGFTIAYPGP